MQAQYIPDVFLTSKIPFLMIMNLLDPHEETWRPKNMEVEARSKPEGM